VCSGVGVDTNIWEYAYAKPAVADVSVLHAEARDFIDALLGDTSRAIILSDYQVCEILEVMRKTGFSVEIRDALYELFWSGSCQVAPCSIQISQEASKLSMESGIHVYDYLVALPLRGLVEVIYTADEHFDHSHFQEIARIENPNQPPVAPDERVGQTIRMMEEVKPEPPLDTQPATAHSQSRLTGDLHHPVVAGVQDQRAADPTIGTRGGDAV